MGLKVITSTLLLSSTALVLASGAEPEAVPLKRPLYSLPDEVGGWQLVSDGRLRPELRGVLGGEDDLVRRYRRDGAEISLMIIYWAQQSADRMIHDPETCLPGSGWSIESSDTANAGRLPIRRYLAERDGSRVLFYLWYVQGGEVQANTVARRVALSRSYFTGRSEGTMIRVLTVVEDGDEESSDQALLDFIEALQPELAGVLP